MSEHDKDPALRVVDRRWWARSEEDRAEAAASTKPTYVEDLEQRVADAAAQLQTYMVEHKRAIDEFEQVKARMRRDVAKEVERGKRQVIAELLEIVDNIDRAIAAVDETPGASQHAVEKLAHGVRLVRDQFLAKLQGFGVVRVPSLGERFDATRHEAITITPVPTPEQDGVVVSVVKEGYAVGDELLRPAGVVVGAYGHS
jgi:molecular chaperone GrpE